MSTAAPVTPAELLAKVQDFTARAQKIEDVEKRAAAMETAQALTAKAIQDIQAAMRQYSFSLPGTEDMKKKGEYSFARVFKALVTNDFSHAKTELDVSNELRKKVGDDMLARLMSTTTPSAGGFLVPEQVQASIVPKLDAQAICKQLGVTVVRPTGYPYRVIKQTGGATASMVGETGTASATDLAWGRINLIPKKMQARSVITQEQVMWSNPDTESQVENDLALRMALKEDQQIIAGTGSDNEVMGILNTSGINTFGTTSTSGTRFQWGDISSAEQQIAEDNVIYQSLGLAVNPRAFFSLARQLFVQYATQTEALGAGFVNGMPFLSKERFKQITGHDILTSTQIPTTSGGSSNETRPILGKWSDFYLANFPGMVLQRSDTATDGTLNAWTQDVVHVKAVSWIDGAVIQPESFCAVTGLIYANLL